MTDAIVVRSGSSDTGTTSLSSSSFMSAKDEMNELKRWMDNEEQVFIQTQGNA